MTDLIPAASPFDAIRRTRDDGSEYWSARDLMPLLGYDKWERFSDSIARAEASAQAQGVDQGFSRLRENLPGGTKPREDVHLSRFACYLVAMNGDPRKQEVAAAQGYFAVKTREAEIGQTATRPALTAAQTAAADAAAVMAVLQAARGLIDPAHLEAKARIVAARAMGEAPEISPEARPVYVQDFVREQGLTAADAARVAPGFGKWLKKAYIAECGEAPGRHVQILPNGQARDVYAYTEADRPLMERAWWAYAINQGIETAKEIDS